MVRLMYNSSSFRVSDPRHFVVIRVSVPPGGPAASEQHDEHRRLALLLEYDGSRYFGSQLQESAPTIQATLEKAIECVTGEVLRTAFAGRTDAGAHARGQTASFLTASQLSREVLLRAINARLPDDVVVRKVADVDLAFDVRRHATLRHYRYSVTTGGVRPALNRGQTWYVPGMLDIAAMRLAAGRLVGERDFAAFGGPLERPEASTVRDLKQFDVQADGVLVAFLLASNAFLPHQVRRMVGALVKVGLGKTTMEQYVAILDGPPSKSGPTAPARGLCLMRVDYKESPFGPLSASLAQTGFGGLDSSAYVC